MMNGETEEVIHEDKADEIDDDHVDIHEESSDTEQEFTNYAYEENYGATFVGKDKKHYGKSMFHPEIQAQDKKYYPGKTPVQESKEIWKHFFDAEILNLMVLHTNEYLESVADRYDCNV